MVVGDFGAEKKIVRNLTLQVQFSPPHAGKGQIPHSPGTGDSQMPGVCPGEEGASLYHQWRIKKQTAKIVPG